MCACLCCIADTWWTESKGGVLGSPHSKCYTSVHLLKPTVRMELLHLGLLIRISLQTAACVKFCRALAWPPCLQVSAWLIAFCCTDMFAAKEEEDTPKVIRVIL